MRKPAEKAGRLFPEDVARLLVEKLCRSQSAKPQISDKQSIHTNYNEVDGCFVEPVQLQVVCRQLWSRLPDDQREIRAEDIDKFGDVYEALTGFYEDAMHQAAAEIGGKEMLVRYWFEKEAITPARTRGLVYKSVSATGNLPNSAVEVLDQAHIVRPMVRGKDTWYELAHDRLIEPVLQANQTWWLKQPRLVRVAKAWDDGGRSSSPVIEHDLEQEIRQADDAKLDPPVRDFVRIGRAGVIDKAQKDRLLKRDLSELGWGVIFATDADPALRAALADLLAYREQQAGQRFRLFGATDGYQQGESASAFQERQATAIERASGDTMPYFLTVVGPPTIVPFEFQYYLGVSHAVGRIAFDTLHEYANYARSVVAAEEGQVALPRRALLFAVKNQDDQAPNYGFEQLVSPLYQELGSADQEQIPLSEEPWDIRLMAEEETRKYKGDLSRLLQDDPPWSLLLTVTHAMSFESGDARQRDSSGALLCQSWPGPLQWTDKEVPLPESYFSAGDLEGIPQVDLLGKVAFLFGMHTAGTPRMDNFDRRKNPYGDQSQQPKELAPEPFIARLPQRLLGHPSGGAVAVIGHVDVNWTTSFFGRSGRGKSSIGAFKFLLRRLMQGYPVGAAMEEFRRRFLRELSRWTEMQMQFNAGQLRDKASLTAFATQETAMIDLRNYIILGDPAARLVFAEARNAPTQQASLAPVAALPELKLHPAAVSSIAWRPGGTQLLTVCEDGSARIWPDGKGDPWIIRLDPGDSLQMAAWRYDGHQIATLSDKGRLSTWNVAAEPGGMATPSANLSEQVDLVVWQPNGTALAVVRGRDLNLYDGATGSLLHTLTGHTGMIRSCAWSPDGHRLATTCRDAVLRIWDAERGVREKALDASNNQESLGLAAWSPNGRFLAYTSEFRPASKPMLAGELAVIRILDATSFALLHELRSHVTPVRALEWHPSGEFLASVSSDKAAVWRVPVGELRFAVERDRLSITRVAYSPDGQILLSTGDDQSIRFWNVESGQEFRSSPGHAGKITDVAWHSDSKSVAIARSDSVALLIALKELPQRTILREQQ